jgi:hypothetical protein
MSFLDKYIKYHDLSTDAPLEYGEFLGAQLLGHAMGWNSLHRIRPYFLHHNTYLCIIGDSTLTRKTTAQYLARQVYPIEFILPEETSPEKLVEELSWGAHKIGFLGEFSGFLKQIGRPSYMSRSVELLNDLFGCPDRYVRSLRGQKGQGQQMEIINCYLSINTTTTPTMFKQYLTTELMEGGFLARFLIIKGEARRRDRGRLSPDVSSLKEEIKNILGKIYTMFSAAGPIYFDFTDPALAYFNQLDALTRTNYDNIKPIAARYLEYAISLSDILYLSDRIGEFLKDSQLSQLSQLSHLSHLSQLDDLFNKQNRDNRQNWDNRDNRLLETIEEKTIKMNSSFIVQKQYLEKAWNMIKPHLDYMKTLGDYVDVDIPIARVMSFFENNNEWSMYSDILRSTRLTTKKLQEAIETLLQNKYLTTKTVMKQTRRGEVGIGYYKKMVGEASIPMDENVEVLKIETNER